MIRNHIPGALVIFTFVLFTSFHFNSISPAGEISASGDGKDTQRWGVTDCTRPRLVALYNQERCQFPLWRYHIREKVTLGFVRPETENSE